MPEDYAAFRARRQAELAADPESKPELTGTRNSKPEPMALPKHGPSKAAAEPAVRPDAAGTGKKVLNLNTAVADANEVERAHNSMGGRGVKKLDMEAIARADKELAGYDKKPKAEKESIDNGRLAQAQFGLREKRTTPDIDSIASRPAKPAAEAAPAPAPKAPRKEGRKAAPVQVSHKEAGAPVSAASILPPTAPEKSTPAKAEPAAVSGSTQFSGMLSAHGQHGNLVSTDAGKPKLGKDITYFGATGGPKTPEEGKRGAPAYNTQQAYQKHIAGGGTTDSYWSERDAKKAATPTRKKAAPASTATEAPAETPVSAPVKQQEVAKAESKTMAGQPAVTKTPAVSESGTKSPATTAPKTSPAPKASNRKSAPVAPDQSKSPIAEPLPESGPSGALFPETGYRRMGPENAPKSEASPAPRNPRQGVLFDTAGHPNPRAAGTASTAPRPSAPSSPRGEVRGEGSHPANVPSPVHSAGQFGGSAVHNHYYGNVNSGTGTQINGNVGGHVMTDNASIGGPGGGSGGGGHAGGGGTINKQIVTGNPTGLQKAAYAAIHTSVNGHSIAGGVNHVTGGGHLGMNDSAGRPIGHPGDSYVQNHEMNRRGAGSGKHGVGMGQHGETQGSQFTKARASRQQATPSQ